MNLRLCFKVEIYQNSYGFIKQTQHKQLSVSLVYYNPLTICLHRSLDLSTQTFFFFFNLGIRFSILQARQDIEIYSFSQKKRYRDI